MKAKALGSREFFEHTARRFPAEARAGSTVTIQTLDDVLAPMRDAWETAKHRGAILDALRDCCSPAWQAPLPAWLAPVVEEAVGYWARHAPTGKRGRHARYATARREAVQDLERYDFFMKVKTDLALNDEDARDMTARWFLGDNPDAGRETTIRDSLARAEKMPPGSRYLAFDDRHQTHGWLGRRQDVERFIALWQEFRPRGKPTPKP